MGEGNPWGPARRAAERARNRMTQAYEAEFMEDQDFAGSENYKTKKPKKKRDF